MVDDSKKLPVHVKREDISVIVQMKRIIIKHQALYYSNLVQYSDTETHVIILISQMMKLRVLF